MRKWAELRTRKKVVRNKGSIQLADDDGRTGEGCYVCESHDELRFVQFNSPRYGDRMFLRICAACLDVVQQENDAMRASAP